LTLSAQFARFETAFPELMEPLMTARVAMFDQSYAHIRDRLDALKLDIDVVTFGKDGIFRGRHGATRPEETEVDYVWLSTHINADGFRDTAFGYIENLKSAKVVQTFNAGLDHPIYKRLAARGMTICNSSAQGIAIAEYALGQVMAVLQPIDEQRALQARREWKITLFREVSQTRWLIVGFGPIGQELATRLRAFGAKIDVIRRSPAPTPLADRIGTMADLGKFVPDADVIVFACSLTDETRGFAGKTFFERVKPGAILVNIARGALIDDAAMITALDSGRLGTAILDVFHEEPLPKDNPLWSHPKVRLTGHTSFGGNGARGRWDQLFLDNVSRYARGEPLARVVDPKDI